MRLRLSFLSGLCLVAAASLQAQAPRPVPEVPRQIDSETVLLPNQWFLKPAGRQIVVGDFPVNIALHPSGAFAAVLHCGYGPHELGILNLRQNRLVSRTNVEQGFYGIAFSSDGKWLICSGAGDETLHVFDFADGVLGADRPIALRDSKQRGVPAGIAISADGHTVYAANVWGHSVSRVRLGGAAPEIAELSLLAEQPASPPDPAPSTDDPAITKRAQQALDPAKAGDPFPYACVLDEPRGRLYVSLWARASVAVIDTAAFQVMATWPVEEHPNEMLLSRDGRRLFVANANRNSVTALDCATGLPSETLVATLPIEQPGDRPQATPPGNTPNALALSPDGKLLFVANANINAVAVFEVEEPGKARSLGFLPTAWYPTSVRLTPDGKKLLVANGKGITSKPNRHGPMPGIKPLSGIYEYIGGLFDGTVSVIDLPDGQALDAQLKTWTAQTFSCVPDTARKMAALDLRDNPVPLRPGDPSPIRHVIYIVKENRTYDQVLGDLPQGNGDPTLCLFPEAVTPNHHALAREFVLLDNFYVESEVSADGHEWSMGAYATDFVEKTWPLSYGHAKGGKFPYPSEGAFEIAVPAGGYLWDRAREAGVSYRNYGEWVLNGKTPDDPCTAKVPALEGHFDPLFRSFDMNYPDVKRTERFISELRRFEAEGEMPRLQIVRLPCDHTSGTSPGALTPTAQVADNDLALGRLVEAVSQSTFWPTTAIFVVEDDAQNGSDHVDAHRTIAFAISPYVRRGSVDSSLYSTASMLRTMELILGLKPMSQFDAAALPMHASFQAKPDLRPYTARPANVDLNARNLQTAWGARESQNMDFSKEDAADDLLLNEVVWRSVKGAHSPMPAPRRAAFVFAGGEDGDED